MKSSRRGSGAAASWFIRLELSWFATTYGISTLEDNSYYAGNFVEWGKISVMDKTNCVVLYPDGFSNDRI